MIKTRLIDGECDACGVTVEDGSLLYIELGLKSDTAIAVCRRCSSDLEKRNRSTLRESEKIDPKAIYTDLNSDTKPQSGAEWLKLKKRMGPEEWSKLDLQVAEYNDD